MSLCLFNKEESIFLLQLLQILMKYFSVFHEFYSSSSMSTKQCAFKIRKKQIFYYIFSKSVDSMFRKDHSLCVTMCTAIKTSRRINHEKIQFYISMYISTLPISSLCPDRSNFSTNRLLKDFGILPFFFFLKENSLFCKSLRKKIV